MDREEHKFVKARRWMRRELSHHAKEYVVCGEVDATKLAENCANAMEIFEGEDYTIPQRLFDISAEEALAHEKAAS